MKKEAVAQKRFKDPAALRESLRDSLISTCDGLTFAQSEKYNPECPDRDKVMASVDRMIRDGWSENEIEETTALFMQGMPIQVEEIPTSGADCLVDNGKVRLDFFVMSQCPYGLSFINNTLRDMRAAFEENIDWHPHFIVGEAVDGFNSLHGPSEVAEDRRQACILREWGKDKWIAQVECFEAGLKACYNSPKAGASPERCAENAGNSCAEKIGIPLNELKTCVEKRSGVYLGEDMALTGKYGAWSSPTAVFNCSKKFSGALPLVSFKPLVCGLFAGEKLPAACPK